MKTISENSFDRFISKRRRLVAFCCLAAVAAGFASLFLGYKDLRYDRCLARARSQESLRKLVYNPSLAGTSIGLSAALKLENIFFIRKDYQSAINILRLVESWNVDNDVKAGVQGDILLLLKIQGKLKEASEMARSLVADIKAKSSLRLLSACVEARIMKDEGDVSDAKAVLKEALEIPATGNDSNERSEVKKAYSALLEEGATP